MQEVEIRNLIEQATQMLRMSYAPYSKYHVGAALLAQDGRVYTGCNIENASYSPSNCAERTAFFKAVSEGVRDFKAIAIIGGPNGYPVGYASPCGVCRQVMMEFCDPETFRVIVAKDADHYVVKTLAEFLPMGFGPSDLL